MKIETLKKKLNTEFNFSESHDILDPRESFDEGVILLTPHYKDKQRPWITKAYNEWVRGDRTIVLVAPLKPTCNYFKKYLSDVAEVRAVKDPLDYNKQRANSPMIIAIYKQRLVDTPNFTISFN
jgi:hypothetical protein